MATKLSALVVSIVFAGLWWVALLALVVVGMAAVGLHESGGHGSGIVALHPRTFQVVWGLFAVTMAMAYARHGTGKRVEKWETMARRNRSFENVASDADDGGGHAAILYLATYLPAFAVASFLTVFEESDES